LKLYKAPENTHNLEPGEISIFLAGSIDMGAAENWQERLTKDLVDFGNLVIYNPRRDDWDSSWVQDPTPGTQFHRQVSWELEHLEASNLAVFYFADDSKSPITLLEFGLMSTNWDKEVIVYCSPKFYRYGNVKVVADRYKIPVYDNYEHFLYYIKTFVNEN
jgi:hypothetical protein